LDSQEKSRLIQEAKLKGVSLEDAKKDEDFVLWQIARRQKVEREKSLIPPSTKQGDDLTSPQAKVRRFKAGEMTPEEQEDFLVEIGAYKRPAK
jgi:transposase-like protein